MVIAEPARGAGGGEGMPLDPGVERLIADDGITSPLRAAVRHGTRLQRALAAAHHLVVSRFDAAQTGVVETDVPQQMRRQFLVRIETAALLHEADTGDLIEALDSELRPQLIELMGKDFDFSALTEVDDTVREEILEELPAGFAGAPGTVSHQARENLAGAFAQGTEHRQAYPRIGRIVTQDGRQRRGSLGILELTQRKGKLIANAHVRIVRQSHEFFAQAGGVGRQLF